MSQIRTGYRESNDENWGDDPVLGRISLLAWDSETFGFPVASFEIGADKLDRDAFQRFLTRFSNWTRANAVLLCSCKIPAINRFWKTHLIEAGFQFVDFGLRASLADLSRANLPKARLKLRIATAADYEALEKLATDAFHHGRYHADPSFPTALANLRYRDWLKRALEAKNGPDRVYVMEHRGLVQGLYHVTVEGKLSDLRLAAIAPRLQGSGLGFGLYASMLHVLKALGMQHVITTISAANTSVMNVYSGLGFRFSEPEAIYHWHSERLQRRLVE